MKRATLLVVLLAAAGPRDPAAPLLDALRLAPSAQQAEALETQVIAAWQAHVTPAVQLLVQHAVLALARHDLATAIGDMDAALDLQSEEADLWRLHAETRFADGDDTGAIADLAQALAREPRCFPALADLSHYAEARNDFRRALDAWRKLLEIDPHARQGIARLTALQRKISGQAL